jgi:hypothetical protein
MLAEVLHIQQPSLVKIDKRTDMHLSTLPGHIEAIGGKLNAIAQFPDGSFKSNTFTDLEAVAPL